ncbi:FMN-dependent NADH-azoreductase [Chitinophaga sp. S165]|uniref:FMN-dependent NADH-azoreductase n=1 Tax=Chitinophaga sp. S165 TaxID=2135462 RepID=UPI000D718EDA|nr:NAD(P)H-dependent oxidoreductase [Chitinophaga sp. S165]PWV55627.1 FMN-dependent NADH-azoreductase [Chitinophaga sp. S165]
MKKILVINASARTDRSKSRLLTGAFVDRWKNIHTNPIISFRELGTADVPHINEKWITASFKPAATRTEEDIEVLRLSDTYISELRTADIIVLGSPMYNWSIPSALKAYIDHIVRYGETWKPNPDNPASPYTGLLENKTLVLLLSRGSSGYEEGEANEHMNFQSTYLKTVFNITGIHNIHVIAINGVSEDKEKLEQSINTSIRDVQQLIEKSLIGKALV